MKTSDVKKLWALSGNQCSFPDCSENLVQELRVDRVLGEEAHIKGEKPKAPRYDPNQSEEDRDSYENRILLCPNHHTIVDSDAEAWTVEKLHDIKARHEKQIESNKQFPLLYDQLVQVVERFKVKDIYDNIKVSNVINVKGSSKFYVDSSLEEGLNTGIYVKSGQKIALFARGLITYDNGHYFSNPEGIICNELGLPYVFPNEEGQIIYGVWPHIKALKTNGGELGRIGSLIGWINKFSEERAFIIGCKREVTVQEDGELYLKVNDVVGAYNDNDGEYRVDIKIIE